MAAPSVQGCGWESSLYDSGWGVWTKVAEGSWVCARAFFGAKFSDGRVAGGAREGLSWVAPRDCRRRHTCAARQCWPRRVATVRRSRRFYCVSRGESGTSARKCTFAGNLAPLGILPAKHQSFPLGVRLCSRPRSSHADRNKREAAKRPPCTGQTNPPEEKRAEGVYNPRFVHRPRSPFSPIIFFLLIHPSQCKSSIAAQTSWLA